MTYDEALRYLLALPRFADQGAAAYRPGLERMEALMDAMGRPHEAFPSIHVAGTNGKGSTASMVAAIATAAGRRTGLQTSPHLFRLEERLRLDGVSAPEDWLADAVTRFRDVFDATTPSFFEATTALSFLYFAEQQVDLAVVEVGLGGRLDATNVLAPPHVRAALITSLALEHTELLGGTLEEIAREKAGIVKPGIPLLTSASAPEALAVLRQVARERSAPFHQVLEEVERSGNGPSLTIQTPLRCYERLHLGVPGAHQQINAVLAVRASEILFDEVQAEAAPVYTGLREVRRLAGLRGRLDVLRRAPFVVADVGHNADGLATALAFMQEERGREKETGHLYVLLGLMRDKDVAGIAHLLAEARSVVLPVALAGERALPAEVLAASLKNAGVAVGEAGSVVEGVARFFARAKTRDALLITGSHQVVADVPGALWKGAGD